MRMSFVVLRLLLVVGNKLILTLDKKHVSSHQRARLIHNDFKLFLSGFPPVSCYWLIARGIREPPEGSKTFIADLFILCIICQHYPHVYETSNVQRRRLYLYKGILLIWLLKQYNCDLKSNYNKENSLARIVNEIEHLQLSDHLSLSSGWYNSNKFKFKSQDLNGLIPWHCIFCLDNAITS